MPAVWQAPVYEPGRAGLPWRQKIWKQGLSYYLPSIVFLLVPIFISDGKLSNLGMAVLVVVTLLVVVFYLGSVLVTAWPFWARALWCFGMFVSLVAIGQVSHRWQNSFYYMIYLTVVVVSLIPWEFARIINAILFVVGLVGAYFSQDFIVFAMVIMGAGVGFGVGMNIRSEWQRRELEAIKERNAVLAVAAERERIGRDLHDILGHSLTTIAVKADLAAKLVDRDTTAAVREIHDLQVVARQALADVRSTASGLREVRLASEIASARSVLQAAGIECEVPSALPVLSEELNEAFAFVVREAVTNVVRHSSATRCSIRLGETSVSISDDGQGFNGVEGNGLHGLRVRLAEAGAALSIESGPKGSTLTARLIAQDSGSDK